MSQGSVLKTVPALRRDRPTATLPTFLSLTGERYPSLWRSTCGRRAQRPGRRNSSAPGAGRWPDRARGRARARAGDRCLQCGRHGFNLWVGKIPCRRAWQSTPVFLPEESPWTEEPGGLQSRGLQSHMAGQLSTAHNNYINSGTRLPDFESQLPSYQFV